MLFVLPAVHSLEQLEQGSPSGAVLIDLQDIAVDELSVLLSEHLLKLIFHVRVPADFSADAAVGLLNAGVHSLVVLDHLAAEYLSAGIPAERLVVTVRNEASGQELVEQGLVGGVVLPNTVAPAAAAQIATLADTLVPQTGNFVRVFVDNADKVYRDISPAVPIIDFEHMTADPAAAPNKIPIADILLSRLNTDRHDGLFYTSVVDQYNQQLGTCFSNKESITEAIRTRTGVYWSRKRGLWRKGASSGHTQRLINIKVDCDGDALMFSVYQDGKGFCHLNTYSCFGPASGFVKTEATVQQRLNDAEEGSYTKRLFSDAKLLNSKIMEEAEELCEAQTPSEIAWEAADLMYFLTVKLAKNGLTLRDVDNNLDAKSLKVTRRKGDAKPKWAAVIDQKANSDSAATPAAAAPKTAVAGSQGNSKAANGTAQKASPAPVPAPAAATSPDADAPIAMQVIEGHNIAAVKAALQRPAQSSKAFDLARPIIDQVRERGDAALLELTAKFDRAQLQTPVLSAPFPPESYAVEPELAAALDLAIANVEKFHSAQLTNSLAVETSPGVVCSRFARAIQRVGLYVPGGSAILPSTAIMLGVPARVAGCKNIVFASPPRADGSLSPEVVYVAHKVGASQIVLAGGAQAVAAMAYGTESVTKVDKILGPGNQFVTAAKMLVQTDVNAQVSIDMPAGPSEVLVVADAKASKPFVVSDLLSQAEHGPDSQVILITIGWTSDDVRELQAELDRQARALPRFEIVRQAIAHSTIIGTNSREEAMRLSNQYAPEHLILQVENARDLVQYVENAGSVFVGALSPESCGDYTSGTNHTLPTYGYANQYSGVNTGTFLKHITSQELTPEGIKNIGPATVALAKREGLDGHANAVSVRLQALGL